MRTIIKVLDHQRNPLGWVEVGKDIFGYSQNLSAGNLFTTREEAIKFIAGLETHPILEEIERDVRT